MMVYHVRCLWFLRGGGGHQLRGGEPSSGSRPRDGDQGGGAQLWGPGFVAYGFRQGLSGLRFRVEALGLREWRLLYHGFCFELQETDRQSPNSSPGPVHQQDGRSAEERHLSELIMDVRTLKVCKIDFFTVLRPRSTLLIRIELTVKVHNLKALRIHSHAHPNHVLAPTLTHMLTPTAHPSQSLAQYFRHCVTAG